MAHRTSNQHYQITASSLSSLSLSLLLERITFIVSPANQTWNQTMLIKQGQVHRQTQIETIEKID